MRRMRQIATSGLDGYSSCFCFSSSYFWQESHEALLRITAIHVAKHVFRNLPAKRSRKQYDLSEWKTQVTHWIIRLCHAFLNGSSCLVIRQICWINLVNLYHCVFSGWFWPHTEQNMFFFHKDVWLDWIFKNWNKRKERRQKNWRQSCWFMVGLKLHRASERERSKDDQHVSGKGWECRGSAGLHHSSGTVREI